MTAHLIAASRKRKRPEATSVLLIPARQDVSTFTKNGIALPTKRAAIAEHLKSCKNETSSRTSLIPSPRNLFITRT